MTTSPQQLAIAKLKSSGLSSSEGARLKIKAVPNASAIHPSFYKTSAIHIPYFTAEGKVNGFYRVRYTGELPGFAGQAKKPQRYAQAPGSLNSVYMPPLLDVPWSKILQAPENFLIVTEGEFKAAASCKAGYPTIGLGGVDVWRSNKRGLPLLPELQKIAWREREVYVIFDSDAVDNPDVIRAQASLVRMLTELGAMPYVVELPPGDEGAKNGLDDFLLREGKKALVPYLERAKENHNAAIALWELNGEVVLIRDPPLIIERDTSIKMTANVFKEHTYANRVHMEEVPTKDGSKLQQVRTAQKWLVWPGRSELGGLTYAPGEEPVTKDGKWNLWKGWGCEPKKGSIEPWNTLLDHLFYGRNEHRRWFEQWCACPLQRPGVKMASTVVMWGATQGTGKTLVGYTLKRIYGANSIEIKNKHLQSDFNSWAENKQFIIGDEVTGSEHRIHADNLKGLITQEDIEINTKFVPTYVVPDHANYYFTSQHPDAFFLDDTDRRYFIWQAPEKPLPLQFYRKVYDPWLKGDGPAALFHHLLHIPLGSFDPYAPAMETPFKLEMIRDSKSDLAVWASLLKEAPAEALRALGSIAAPKAELLTSAQLLRCYDPEGATRVTANGLTRELKRAGFAQWGHSRVVKTSCGTQRFFVVREFDKWKKLKQPVDAAAHWDKLFGPKPKKF